MQYAANVLDSTIGHWRVTRSQLHGMGIDLEYTKMVMKHFLLVVCFCDFNIGNAQLSLSQAPVSEGSQIRVWRSQKSKSTRRKKAIPQGFQRRTRRIYEFWTFEHWMWKVLIPLRFGSDQVTNRFAGNKVAWPRRVSVRRSTFTSTKTERWEFEYSYWPSSHAYTILIESLYHVPSQKAV